MNVWLLFLSWLFYTPQNTEYYSLSADDFFALTEVNETINPNQFNDSLLEAAIFHATNQYRASKRKPLLKPSTVLVVSAKLHSNSMLNLNFFNHINKKNKALKTPYDRVRYAGGSSFTSVAENLIEASLYQLGKKGAYFLKDGKLVDKKQKALALFTYKHLAKSIVERWSKSKGHNQNLLDAYSFLGCGVSTIKTEKDGLKVVYVTQNFGSKN